MNHISDMFGKLKSAFINQSDKKTAVILACAETTGVNLKPEQIEINNKTLRLMVSSSAKTTIFLKRNQLIECLADKVKPQITEIR
jgi:vacuolar-type H+-ATPase subunit B/Vma2